MTRLASARRAVSALLGLLLLAGSIGASAQAPWFVYLFDTGAQALVRVGADGAQTTLPLGMAPNEATSAFDMSFSPDGARVAFCALNYGDNTAPPTATLIVRDLAAQADLLRQPLGAALGCRATYRTDGAFLALSLVHHLPGDPAAAPDEPVWELRVLDAASGSAIGQLRADGPEATAAGLGASGAILPVVRRFEGAELIFAALPFAAGGPSAVPAWRWRVDTASLTQAEPWGSLQLDALPGAEIAWTASDPNRPAGQPPGPLPPDNVARVMDAAGQTQTVFASPDWLLIGARFIDDGRRLALQLVAPFDPSAVEVSTPTRWIAVDRSGALTELTSTASYAQLAGVPGGYVVLQAFTPEGGGAPTYTLDYNTGGQISTLWTAPGSASAYDLAYATPIVRAADLPPFTGLP
jgi:hypothetical protein